jgi:hypothetical protein
MNLAEFKKPVKTTGRLTGLTEPQEKQLAEWLNSTMTYKEMMDLVKKDFGITLSSPTPLKQFRKRMLIAQLEARPICPPGIPREVWDASLAEMEKVLRDKETTIEQRVRVSAFLLQLSRLTLDQNRLSAKLRARKAAKAKAVSDNQNVPEENPLDDQDKLDEVRCQVFGSAPE